MISPKSPPDANTFNDMVDSLNSISGEPRSSVLITHLYVEYLMDSILRKKISKPDKTLKSGFASKLELIESLQILSDEIMHDLWLVNEVRNQFAYEIDIESTDFQSAFLEKVYRMRYYSYNANRFEGMPARHIYSMIMMSIYAILKSEYDKL